MLDKIVKEHFFIIRSDDPNSFASAFYGFAVTSDEILVRANPTTKFLPPDTSGIFVNIVNLPDALLIQQDFFCGYGLFVFEQDSFWAISNSLFLLMHNLYKDYEFKLNERVLSTFMLSGMTYSETGVKEIRELKPQQFVVINKKTNGLSIVTIPWERSILRADSGAAIAVLDKWKNKWFAVVSSLVDAQLPVSIQLSGGRDSRASFAVTRPLNIESGKIQLASYKSTLHTWGEDYTIAAQIASIYKFKHNLPLNIPKLNVPPLNAIELSIYTKFMQSSNFVYPDYILREPLFVLSGFGGEAIRGYLNLPLKDVPKHWNFPDKFGYMDMPVFANAFSNMKAMLDEINTFHSEDLHDLHKLWYYTRMKNHFGRFSVELLMQNQINLSPLMDPILSKLDLKNNKSGDMDFVFALIYERFLPELEDIRFDSNHKLSKEVKDLAKSVNKAFSYKQTDTTKKYKIILKKMELPESDDVWIDFTPRIFLKAMIKSQQVKDVANKYFNTKLYDDAVKAADLKYDDICLPKKLITLYFLDKFIHHGH